MWNICKNLSHSYFSPKIALLNPPFFAFFLFFFFKLAILPPSLKLFCSCSKNLLLCQLSIALKKNASISTKFPVNAKIFDWSTLFPEGGSMLFHQAVKFILTRVLCGDTMNTCIYLYLQSTDSLPGIKENEQSSSVAILCLLSYCPVFSTSFKASVGFFRTWAQDIS